MELSNVLATIALIVSIASAWLSYRANKQATLSNEREQRREFDRERSEFLIKIERTTKTFENAGKRISTLLEEFEKQPDSLQASHQGDIEQLQSDLKYLEGCLRQSRTLWDENFATTHDGLAYHKARHSALLEDDSDFVQTALERADKVEASLGTSLMFRSPIMG